MSGDLFQVCFIVKQIFFGAACLVGIPLHFPPCRCELEWKHVS